MRISKYWVTLGKVKANQFELALQLSSVLKWQTGSEILQKDYYNLPKDTNIEDKEDLKSMDKTLEEREIRFKSLLSDCIVYNAKNESKKSEVKLPEIPLSKFFSLYDLNPSFLIALYIM